MVYGLAQFITIEFLINCIEELNIVSAGEQPAGAKVSLWTFLCVSPPVTASSKSVRARPRFKVVSPQWKVLYFKSAAF